MVITINSNSTPEEIKTALEKLYKGNKKTADKHLDASKYNGTIKLKEDPLSIQKTMRDEWR
jgi:hypothetical protein